MLPIKDTQGSGRFPFWVLVIIAINVYIFFQELTAPDPQTFINHYALIPSLINLTEPKTFESFFTSMFLHAGFLHIISNMLFLWVFGDNVESYLGFFFFPIFYLLAGFIADFAQYLIMPTANIPMLGASGAIAGVLGVYLARFPGHRIKSLIFIVFFFTVIDIPAGVLLLFWFITQLFNGASSFAVTSANTGGIAFIAHIAGFTFGLLIGKLIEASRTVLEPLP